MAHPKGVETRQGLEEMMGSPECGREGGDVDGLSGHPAYQHLGGLGDGLCGRNDSRFRRCHFFGSDPGALERS